MNKVFVLCVVAIATMVIFVFHANLYVWGGRTLLAAEEEEPTAWWDFNDTLVDKVNGIELEAKNKPVYKDGSIILDNEVTWDKYGDTENNQYLYASSPLLDMGTGDFSLEVTFRPDRYPKNTAFLIGKGNKGQGGWYLLSFKSYGQISTRLNDDEGGDARIQVEPFIECRPGKWYHIVAVYDRDGELCIYVNGERASAKADISKVANVDNTGTFNIGMLFSQYFSGLIDEVRIYKHVLSAEEIKMNFKEAVKRHPGAEFPNRQYDNIMQYPTAFKLQKVLGEKGVSRRDPSDIIKVGNKYYVWYTKVVKSDLKDSKADHYPSGYPGNIWFAVSPDGKKWVEQGEALHKGGEGAFDEHGIFTPNILVMDDKYYLFYTAVAKTAVLKKSHTAIGVAVSDFPDGPWERFQDNPILQPSKGTEKFDSFRCDDTCFIAREGEYWMYYKGRRGDSSSGTKGRALMCLAVADNPTGPYVKYTGELLLHPTHEVLVWPTNGGVASLVTRDFRGREKGVYFAKDGLSFDFIKKLQGIHAPGLYRSDHFKMGAELKPIRWGICHKNENDGVALYLFECIYSN